MEDIEKLQEFMAGSSFSDPVFAKVFRDLIENYKDESERQHTIRAIIEIWKQKYPSEVEEFGRVMQKFRETRDNEYAANFQGDQRHVFKFPRALWERLAILIQDPPFLSQSDPQTQAEKDEWAWVIKNFPEFVVPTKI